MANLSNVSVWHVSALFLSRINPMKSIGGNPSRLIVSFDYVLSAKSAENHRDTLCMKAPLYS